MNKVEVKGKLVREPKYIIGSKTAVCFGTVFFGKDYIPFRAFGDVAETIGNMKKDDDIHIKGKLQQNKKPNGEYELVFSVEEVVGDQLPF